MSQKFNYTSIVWRSTEKTNKLLEFSFMITRCARSSIAITFSNRPIFDFHDFKHPQLRKRSPLSAGPVDSLLISSMLQGRNGIKEYVKII